MIHIGVVTRRYTRVLVVVLSCVLAEYRVFAIGTYRPICPGVNSLLSGHGSAAMTMDNWSTVDGIGRDMATTCCSSIDHKYFNSTN